jgi:hypothetical protein
MMVGSIRRLDPSTPFDDGVTITIARLAPVGDVARFALPVVRGRLADVATLRASKNGAPLAIAARELLADHDAPGARRGVRAVVIELPATALDGDATAITLRWRGGAGDPPSATARDFASTSAAASETVRTAARTIVAASWCAPATRSEATCATRATRSSCGWRASCATSGAPTSRAIC